jgi:hypothetical protein
MKILKSASALLFIAAIALLLSSAVGWNPLIVGSALVLFSFIPKPEGVAFMAITKEIWTKDIVANLYKNNEFAKLAFNADMYVLLGKVVHIPVAGTPSQVKKNLTVFPQTAVKRTDADITYAIDTFYSLPRHIERIEQYELAYDKRQSALGEDQSQLIQTAMDNLLYRWATTAANYIFTLGNPTGFSLSGAAGTRTGFTKAAFAQVKLEMDRNNIPFTDRIALLTADHYNQLLDSLSDPERTDVGRVADLATGLIGRYLGISIYMRSQVLRYRGADINTLALVDEYADDYAPTADDRAGSLIYHKDCVERALGSVEIFDNPGKAEYYGDIYSMLLRLGGRTRRPAGVYAIVEDLV